MKIRTFVLVCLVCLLPIASAANSDTEGIFASIETNRGEIKLQLFYKRAPLTVINFIKLSTGSEENKPLYSDLKFHRVVKDFMVQTGDPLGTGKGGPGYTFADEFHPHLKHDGKGILSMANRGLNTNGSQFFITLKATPWLDQHHTVFGKIVNGIDVLESIEQGDSLRKIRIIRIGQEAKSFNSKSAELFAVENQKFIYDYYVPPIPEKMGTLDVKRVPVKSQDVEEPGDFEFIATGYQGINVPGKMFYLDHSSALERAIKLTRFARSEKIIFSDLIDKYSDLKGGNSYKNKRITPDLPAVMKNIFRLRSGQISDPIDTPRGIYIFHRL